MASIKYRWFSVPGFKMVNPHGWYGWMPCRIYFYEMILKVISIAISIEKNRIRSTLYRNKIEVVALEE